MVNVESSRKGERRLSLPAKDLMAAVAVTRFGLGARPGEIEAAKADPQGWLTAQVRRDGADLPQSDGETAAQRFAWMRDFQEQRRMERQRKDGETPQNGAAFMDAQRQLRERVNGDFLARAQLGASTPAGFRERWVLFWANHFTVSSTTQITSVLIGPFEREAIRPHVFGRFEDLLVASSTHPAMLTYLDQAQSVGPGSMVVSRRRQGRGGLNENLAREILELHTVGVDAGYSQADVTEFARALTGFSVGRDAEDRAGQFVFRVNTHEPARARSWARPMRKAASTRAWRC